MTRSTLQAPFPYFGGKSRAAELIWSRFGNVVNYVEPFAGSLAVLLQRPRPFDGVETVNDKDGLLCNFWRALSHDPEAVAYHADWPVNECDLHARHLWLVEQREAITRRLEGDPEYFDAKLAGWWVWGISCWIGGGWCKGDGPWRAVIDEEGHRQFVNESSPGVSRERPHLTGRGQGVHKKRIHLSGGGQGAARQLIHLGDQGQGVNRKRPGAGVTGRRDRLFEWFALLAERLQQVRVCCGDWSRITGPSVTVKHGLAAILLDPPYADTAGRDSDLYAKDSLQVAHDARAWAIANGDSQLLRIALCGYDGEHEMPANWECVKWRPRGGYDGQNKDRDNQNKERERIWFSPHCVRVALPLFGE